MAYEKAAMTALSGLRIFPLAALLITGSAHAGDVLLAQMTDQESQAGVGVGQIAPAMTLTPILVMSNPVDPSACIGCDAAVQFALNTATTQHPLTAEYLAPTEPNWNNFFADLSGSTDYMFWMSHCLNPTAGSPAYGCGAFANGNPQSVEFGKTGAFATRTVDFIKVIVTQDSYGYAANGPAGGSRYYFDYAATWQFWGSGAPVGGIASPVPTPGTPLLLLTGLFGLAVAEHHRRSKLAAIR